MCCCWIKQIKALQIGSPERVCMHTHTHTPSLMTARTQAHTMGQTRRRCVNKLTYRQRHEPPSRELERTSVEKKAVICHSEDLSSNECITNDCASSVCVCPEPAPEDSVSIRKRLVVAVYGSPADNWWPRNNTVHLQVGTDLLSSCSLFHTSKGV